MNTEKSRTYTHLIYDLYGCPSQLLTDSAQAAGAMVQACRSADLNVVNQLVHVYPNDAYSITIFLSESHISLHTWPEHSFCALDIFLCRGDIHQMEISLLSFLRPQRQFKINLARGTTGAMSPGNWTTTRGQPGYYEAYETKRILARHHSKFQLIELIENERFGKVLLLDKDVQLSTSDEHIYHEMLVHPVMRAHPLPKKVLIIGGGDGGTLREVLKYTSVKRAVLVDIDAEVIRHCREWMPEVSAGAFDDSRVMLINKDAAEYQTDERFDVIIVDLTAPAGVSLSAYRNLTQHIGMLLCEGGMVAMHSGWWWAGVGVDYPTLLLEEFPHVVLKDQWIPSFACFWSFVIAWKHSLDSYTALVQISKERPEVLTKHFCGWEFAYTAFVREPLPKN